MSELPIAYHFRGEPIPNLREIERGRWRAALEPLTEDARIRACNTATDSLEARGVLIELELDELDRRDEVARTVAESVPMPAPSSTPLSRPRTQISVRLDPADHQRLVEAAALMGATPTQLARIFIVNGTRRALHEHA